MSQMSFVIEREVPQRIMLRDLPASEWPVNRLQNYGAPALSTAEIIAAIIQTPDAISLAQELLTRFKSLTGIQRATISELCAVRGLGPAKATQLKAALELGRRAIIEKPNAPRQITSPADAANLIMSDMALLEQEELWVMILDTKSHILEIERLYHGSTNATMIRVAEVFRLAIRINGTAIIVAHNHPSGDPTPSPEDVAITRMIYDAGKLTDIDLIDHLIIGRQRFVSLKERGLGFG